MTLASAASRDRVYPCSSCSSSPASRRPPGVGASSRRAESRRAGGVQAAATTGRTRSAGSTRTRPTRAGRAARSSTSRYDPGHTGPNTVTRSSATESRTSPSARATSGPAVATTTTTRTHDPMHIPARRSRPSARARTAPASSGAPGGSRTGPIRATTRSTSGSGRPTTTARTTRPRSSTSSPGNGAPHVRYDKSSIIMMDALASDTHIALEQFRIDSGSDFVWEALGEAYGTNEWIDETTAHSRSSAACAGWDGDEQRPGAEGRRARPSALSSSLPSSRAGRPPARDRPCPSASSTARLRRRCRRSSEPGTGGS